MSDELQSITQGLAAEFAAVAATLIGAGAQAAPDADPVEPGWVILCPCKGTLAGTWSLYLSEPEARGLAARLRKSPAESENEIADGLVEITDQALAALVARQAIPGLTATVIGAQPGTAMTGTPAGGFACRIDDALTVRVACTFEPAAARTPAPRTGVPAAALPLRGPTRPPSASLAAVGAPDNLELILDIDMPLSVRFGEATLTLESLSRVGPGSLIELSRQPDDPVDLLINGRLVARGEVVVVSGNYGVRITEVVSAAERIRTINA